MKIFSPTTINDTNGVTKRAHLAGFKGSSGAGTLYGSIRNDDSLALTDDTLIDIELVYDKSAIDNTKEIKSSVIQLTVATNTLAAGARKDFDFDLAAQTGWKMAPAMDVTIKNASGVQARTVEAYVIRDPQ